jgi:dihydroorotate dehydrogenase electron transfer subunit
MIQENVEVLYNNQISPSHYNIGLSCPAEFLSAVPGQFVMLRLADHIDPLLRRPFSIHKLITKRGSLQGIAVLYKVVGTATQIMSQLIPGDQISMLGPLGNGFLIPERVQRIFIVAGGIGAAPMPFLLCRLLEKNDERSRYKVFLGAKSKNDLLCIEDFSNLGIKACTTTDDGSLGDQCLVTDPVETEIAQGRPDVMYACGPMSMLSCVGGIAEKHGIECQVSIETMMACGMGACLGCAVERRHESQKYLHACLDGPVFDARMLKL